MWILKNSKDLLDNLKSRSFSQVSSIKTFDFSTLYTTLPHDILKTCLKETIHKAFSHRNYGSLYDDLLLNVRGAVFQLYSRQEQVQQYTREGITETTTATG